MAKKVTKASTDIDMLLAIEKIVELAENSQLSKSFYRKAAKYINYVADIQHLTKEQSVMLALFVNRSNDSCIRLSDICMDTKCSNIAFLRYRKDIDVLVKRDFLRFKKDTYQGSLYYRIPLDVLQVLQNDETYCPKRLKGIKCEDLFSELEFIFKQRKYDDLNYEAMTIKINILLEDNTQLEFVKSVDNYFPINDRDFDDDRMLFLLFSHLYVNNNDNDIRFSDLDFLYEDIRHWSQIKGWLSRGEHWLIEEKLIEFTNDYGMVDRESFCLSQKVKDEFLKELDLTKRRNNRIRNDVILFNSIAEKKLFFEDMVHNQVDELGNLLEIKNYKDIHTRLRNSGFRCGFTCLFYGAPGTGKTEAALQLARMTGRDIMQVNISKIKSCWVGESEKNIKNIFDNYRERVEKSEVTPILLFNEADAIINKRNEGAERALDKMENSFLNIILQEMENLDGILIATTNLAGNMDKAFERRFLYKIKFEKPTLEARMSIWHTMIPALDENVTRTLAQKYDFSGGQIENIARHYAINNILHGESDNILETLSTYCDNERLETKETRKIGF